MLICACAGVGLVVVLGLLLYPRPEASEARYDVTFLPNVGGHCLSLCAMNDLGQVVGMAEVQLGQWHIFLWDKNAGLRDLGAYADVQRFTCLQINNAGQIAGGATDPNGTGYGFLVDPNGARRVLRAPSGEHVQIQDLNSRGQIVGYCGRGGGPLRGFIWDKTAGMQGLTLANAYESIATGINDRGQIVGSYSAQLAGPWTVFLWDPNMGDRNIGPAKAGRASPHINNQAFVVGKFDAASDMSILSLWTEQGGLRRVCPARGVSVQIDGLNNANCFVACTSGRKLMIRNLDIVPHIDSYLWDPNGGFTELANCLERADVFEFFALGINDKGQIVGSLRLKGQPNPFIVVLQPIPSRRGANSDSR